MMNPRSKRRLAIGGAVLILAAIAILAAPGFSPVYRFFARFPGIIHWVSLLLLIGIAAAYAIARGWGEERVQEGEGLAEPGTGELAPLAEEIERGEDSEFARARLVHELSEIAARLIARKEGIGLTEARERLRGGEWTDDQATIRLLCRRDSQPVSEDEFQSVFERAVDHLERFYQEV